MPVAVAARRAAAISATAVAGWVLETASRRGGRRPASRAAAARRSRTAFRACAYMRLGPGRAGFLARIRGYTAAQGLLVPVCNARGACMDIAELLAFSVKNKASDLHLSAGLPPMIRVDGDVRRINIPALDHQQAHALVYDIMSDKQRRDYEEFLEVDFSFEIAGLARFRVNAFNQNRGAGAVFRTIPSEVLTLEDLATPRIFKELIDQPQGLILVTGP